METIPETTSEIDRPWADVPIKLLGTWFETLKREVPLARISSCCGLGDAYEADILDTEGEILIATITDGRAFCYVKRYTDEKGGYAELKQCRKEIPEGMRFVVPPDTRVSNQGNPSGHGVIFISQQDLKTVVCFVTGALL